MKFDLGFTSAATFKNEDYATAEVAAHQEVQTEFGEQWIHIPYIARPNFAGKPDPSKPAYSLTGVFSWEAKYIKLGMEEAGVASREPILTVLRANLRCEPKNGDLFKQARTGNTFAVTDIEKDSTSGVKINLVEMGVPE